MNRTRARLQVEVDLDPMPGMFHEVEDHAAHLTRILGSAMPHYNPKVTVTAIRKPTDALWSEVPDTEEEK